MHSVTFFLLEGVSLFSGLLDVLALVAVAALLLS
jgi:hypothetical protein